MDFVSGVRSRVARPVHGKRAKCSHKETDPDGWDEANNCCHGARIKLAQLVLSATEGMYGSRSPPVHLLAASRQTRSRSVQRALAYAGRSIRLSWRIMRSAYHDQLDQFDEALVHMTKLVNAAMIEATNALLDADLVAAESVIAGDEAIDAVAHDMEEQALQLVALQARSPLTCVCCCQAAHLGVP